jgi:hypothetical protein
MQQRYSLDNYLRLADQMDRLEFLALELGKHFSSDNIGKASHTKFSIPLAVGLQKLKSSLEEILLAEYPELNPHLLNGVFYGHFAGKATPPSTKRKQAVLELAKAQRAEAAKPSFY